MWWLGALCCPILQSCWVPLTAPAVEGTHRGIGLAVDCKSYAPVQPQPVQPENPMQPERQWAPTRDCYCTCICWRQVPSTCLDPESARSPEPAKLESSDALLSIPSCQSLQWIQESRVKKDLGPRLHIWLHLKLRLRPSGGFPSLMQASGDLCPLPSLLRCPITSTNIGLQASLQWCRFESTRVALATGFFVTDVGFPGGPLNRVPSSADCCIPFKSWHNFRINQLTELNSHSNHNYSSL